MPFVPITSFAPDQPQIIVSASNNVLNVLPITEASYGPFPSAQPYSNALGARCQGAYALQDTAGNVAVFAGDATKLYRLPSGTLTPADVSNGTFYTTGATERWSMCLFGLTVIATNYTQVPQSYVEGTSSQFGDMIQTGSTTLKGRYLAVIRDQVFLGNTNDDVYGVQPQRVWWSKLNDPTTFTEPSVDAAALSDYQDIVGDHGWVMGLVGNLGSADGAVFMERAVIRIIKDDVPTIFRFDPAEGARGCPAPGSIIHHGAFAYYLSDEGFMRFDGANSTPIGRNKVDRFFQRDVDQGQLHRVSGAADPSSGMMFWAYPTNGASNCNRLIVYNPTIDRWSVTEVGAVEVDLLLRSLSFGFTLDSMDALFPNADNINISGDSRVWTGGRLQLSCFDSAHKLAHFNGTPLDATVETQEANLFSGKRGMVTEVRPIVDGATALVSIGSRDNPTQPTVYGPTSAMKDTGQCVVRSAGRYQKARITVPAAAGWDHISGIEITKAAPMGAR